MGDYHYYLAEFATCNERKDMADKSLNTYKADYDVTVTELPPTPTGRGCRSKNPPFHPLSDTAKLVSPRRSSMRYHIIKEPSDPSNNQAYEAQICHHLDRGER